VFESLMTILNMFLGLIVAVSLVMGGIDIMYILLASVTERTREIGIRKAVGAKRRDIPMQFLLEAMVLSLVGGLIGVAIGVMGTVSLSLAAEDLALHISASTIVMAAGFATGVGLVFGIYPAVRASSLQQVDALHYE